jgi:hypothetical protein
MYREDNMKKLLLALLLLPALLFSQMKFMNNTVSISSTGDLSFPQIHFFGYKEDTTITPNCLGTALYAKIASTMRTGYGLVENDGFTYGGDSLKIITPGDYFFQMSYTIQGANNEDFKFAFFKNNTKVYGTRRSTSTGNYSGGTTPFYFLNLVANDVISWRVANLTAPGTNDATITNFNIFAYKMIE